MVKRMLIMLVIVGLLFGGIFGYRAHLAQLQKQSLGAQSPPATVSTTTAGFQDWQPQLKAVGSLSAVLGVDVTSEISGLVQAVQFNSGDEAKEGQSLVQLNADLETAQLRALEAAAALAQITYDRDSKQLAAQAVSQSIVDADAADLKSKQAQVAAQAALVAKKTIRAPFAGRLGITTVNPGQYINPGDKIVTLQSLDPIHVDFYLPQQNLAVLLLGQQVILATDTFPGRTFNGKITSINPKVDPDTRNVEIEATIDNPKHELLPGMYGTVEVQAGKAERYLTLPQTAVVYNPYGDSVYIVEESGRSPDRKPIMVAKQTFVTVGPTRGDQVAILTGVKEGDTVITGGQLKIKNGSVVIINNQVQPSNEAAPRPVDQ